MKIDNDLVCPVGIILRYISRQITYVKLSQGCAQTVHFHHEAEKRTVHFIIFYPGQPLFFKMF